MNVKCQSPRHKFSAPDLRLVYDKAHQRQTNLNKFKSKTLYDIQWYWKSKIQNGWVMHAFKKYLCRFPFYTLCLIFNIWKKDIDLRYRCLWRRNQTWIWGRLEAGCRSESYRHIQCISLCTIIAVYMLV